MTKASLAALQRRLASLESRWAPRRSYLVEAPDCLLDDSETLQVALSARGTTGFLALASGRMPDAEVWAARYAGWRGPA